jgi:hypothetical protein
MTTGRSGAVVNSHEIVTGDFTRDTEFRIPGEDLALSLQARLQDGLSLFDASELARKLLGDSIFTNQMLLGAAWQRGLIPLSRDAILQAVELNGAAVERNKQAFEMGRWAIVNPDAAERLIEAEVVAKPKTLDEKIAFRADHLTAYQGKRLAKRYRKLVDPIPDPRLKEAVAKGYHKLLSYKDEYEVARLHLETEAKAREAFDGDFTLKYHLAPPMLPGKDAAGRPKKREFGAWIGRLYPILARLKGLARHAAGRVRLLRRAADGTRPDQAIPGRHGRVPAKGRAPDDGRARGAGRTSADHPRLRPGEGAQRPEGRQTARGPDRPSARGRGAVGRGCRIGAGRRRRRIPGPSDPAAPVVFSVFLER